MLLVLPFASMRRAHSGRLAGLSCPSARKSQGEACEYQRIGDENPIAQARINGRRPGSRDTRIDDPALVEPEPP